MTDEQHRCRHDGHELDIGAERQAIHLQHRFGNMIDTHRRFGSDAAIGLRDAGGHARGHRRFRVADVDLAARDVERAPVVRRAARLLIARLEGREIEIQWEVEAELFKRASVAPPPLRNARKPVSDAGVQA